ncbi:hypothetical protein GIB67_032491 [Kingdonia uniflora]|uniref:Protein SCAI n=1 Tax=Kingdonia uniflora TaxID=39325 RepID=A0A7J7L7J4_9MAGN|nr:hypothetical protein GIB67_032491 [Kingdonia uniflora]
MEEQITHKSPIYEEFCSLVNKADKKFTRIKNLPYHGRARYESCFHKAFDVYTKLWKLQQEKRSELMEAGLKRWVVGEIASRIAQLYYGQYIRTSDANYLSDSQMFYKAILDRGYFKEGYLQNCELSSKQLKCLARSLIVCLVSNRRDIMVYTLNQLKLFLAECKQSLQLCCKSHSLVNWEGRSLWKLVSVRLSDADAVKGVEVTAQKKILRLTTVTGDDGDESLLVVAADGPRHDRGWVFDSGTTLHGADYNNWKRVVKEIDKFLKVDTDFMNLRPLRYSPILDTSPNSLPEVVSFVGKRGLKLQEAILSSYHQNEVKLTDLTVDTFRMLQCLEWEPSGVLYKPKRWNRNGAKSNDIGILQQMEDLTLLDLTLPPNLRKAILYRPTATYIIAVLATMCVELPPDGVLLVYLSASGKVGNPSPLPSHSGNPTERTVGNFQVHDMASKARYSFSSYQHDIPTTSYGQIQGAQENNLADCLWMGPHENGGLNCIYPSDIIPFTRRPIFLVIDSDNSQTFKAIHGQEKGEPSVMLLSPITPISNVGSAIDFARPQRGSQFTMFLTTPLQAFCYLLGYTESTIKMDVYNKAQKLLTSLLKEWGLILATSETLNPVWAQVLCDPFLWRLIVRFIFCRAVIALYALTYNNKELLPDCLPQLPLSVDPMSTTSQTAIMRIANIFDATNHFKFSDGIKLPETDEEASISPNTTDEHFDTADEHFVN